MVNNSLVEKKETFSEFMARPAIKKLVSDTIGGKDGLQFMTSIVSAVAANTTGLQKCSFQSILSAAMIGQSLKLSPSPQMGHYYLIPFSGTAQFQMGYKGYIQLALRSGHYKDIDAMCIKEGEFKGLDKNTGKPVFEFVQDPDKRDALPVVGYMAYFEMTNGFVKKIYWTRSAMEAHGKKYSKSYSSFWGKGEDGFNGQAIKTVIKQLLSRWALLSPEMQKAIEAETDEQLPFDTTEQQTKPTPKDDPFLQTVEAKTEPLELKPADNVIENEQGVLIDKNTGKPI